MTGRIKRLFEDRRWATTGAFVLIPLLALLIIVGVDMAASSLADAGSVGNCYKSTMGNPDQVVLIHNTPFACTNALHGYRCIKMEPCR